MPNVYKDGDFYKITRITGPKHNLLSVKFGNSELKVEKLMQHSPSAMPMTNDVEVTEEVLKGVARANDRLGKAFKVSVIQYVPDDSAPASVYGDLAELLVEAKNAEEIE